MRKILLSAALLALLCGAAHADNYLTVPNPTAVWDTTTATLFAIGVPGNKAKTIIPSAATTNLWTGANTFSGLTTFSGGSVGPAPVACGATCTASLGKTYLLNTAAGSVGTLPAATATGGKIDFLVTVAVSSNADKILTNPVTDTLIGTAIGENAGTAKIFVGNASTYHSIQMPFAGTQPSGGFIGDKISCQDIAVGIWDCNIVYQAGTTPTTPYSASTT